MQNVGRLPQKAHSRTQKAHKQESSCAFCVLLCAFCGPVLPNSGVLSIQRLAQSREVRIKSDKTCRALKECPAASLIANPVQRALTITRRQATVACQTHCRRIETEDRIMTFVDRT